MMKILLCLLACLCIANIAYSLDITEVVKSDELVLPLLSEHLGTDSRFKSLLQIQNAAYRMSEKRLTEIDVNLRNKLLHQLGIAARAGNREKINELIGRLLFIIFKLESKDTVEKIISRFRALLASPSSPNRKRQPGAIDELFYPIYEQLLEIDGGVTLLFAIDTTASMHHEIVESKKIATDIINEPQMASVDYILSPFNDPGTGPVTYRGVEERSSILDDIQHLKARGGGDCPEFSYKGMQDALDYGPQIGSSMFVFTDAAPKDGTLANVQTLLDTAACDDIKISFFLNERTCGLKDAIDTYRKVAADTGGSVFTFKVGSSRHLKRKLKQLKKGALSSSSLYSSFVKSSLRGTTLIRSKPAGTDLTQVTETIDIDDQISFVTVIVTTNRRSPESVTLIDAAGVSQVGSKTTNGIVFNIDNPIAGEWTLTYSGIYSYSVFAAFKSPIAIDVRYFYEPRPESLTMVSRPLRDAQNQMIINVVGADNIELSSVRLSLLRSDGSRLTRLRFLVVISKSGLKLEVKFKPTNEAYRVRISGKTKKGYKFERLTNQIIKPALVVFKTIKAGDEYSAAIGSTKNRILTFAYVRGIMPVSAKFNAHAKLGKVTVVPRPGSQRFRHRKVLLILYDAPSEARYKGRSDHITIDVGFEGEITTHRLSVLLV